MGEREMQHLSKASRILIASVTVLVSTTVATLVTASPAAADHRVRHHSDESRGH
jgi:hypothetical protein